VYNLLCKDSFNRVQSWVKELRKMANKNIVLVIAGNKSDRDKMQHLNVGDAERSVSCFLHLIPF
jgi:GTPase SAR1 family protein